MNALSSLPAVFREALAVYAIFGAAGVSAEDIFMVPGAISPEGAPDQLGVQARQGDLTFTVTVGLLGMTEDDFRSRWPRVAAVWNDLSPDRRKAVVDAAAIRRRAVEIFAAMAVKGFRRGA